VLTPGFDTYWSPTELERTALLQPGDPKVVAFNGLSYRASKSHTKPSGSSGPSPAEKSTRGTHKAEPYLPLQKAVDKAGGLVFTCEAFRSFS
jgi:hypothetical protein